MTRRVIAITGAGGALGAALSAHFAGEPDTDLVLSDVSAPALEATVSGLPEGAGPVETQLADVSDFAQVEAVVARAVVAVFFAVAAMSTVPRWSESLGRLGARHPADNHDVISRPDRNKARN